MVELSTSSSPLTFPLSPAHSAAMNLLTAPPCQFILTVFIKFEFPLNETRLFWPQHTRVLSTLGTQIKTGMKKINHQKINNAVKCVSKTNISTRKDALRNKDTSAALKALITFSDETEAIDELQQIVRLYKDNMSFWTRLADAYTRKGHLRAAVCLYEQLSEIEGGHEYAIPMIQGDFPLVLNFTEAESASAVFVTCMDNLELVHEIAIDADFRIPDQPTHPLQLCVRETMHRAYYNQLRRDLAKEPPELEYCFSFLMELKKMILEDILTAQHTRLKGEINQMLREEDLRSKLEQGNLDVKEVMKYIIDLWSRLCCPGRDVMVTELRSKTDIIELFQGTMDLLELMKNDLANYQINQNRAAIEAYRAEREFEMFKKFLEANPNGINFTRQWLQAAYEELFEEKKQESNSSKKEKRIEETEDPLIDTTSRGYVKLVQVDEYRLFPETLKIDLLKIECLAEKFLQIVVCASAVFVTCNVAGKQVSESADFKKTLKDHLIVITNNTDEGKIRTDLKKVAEQCVKEAIAASKKLNVEWEAEKSTSLRNQIKALANPDNPIRKLVRARVATFVEQMLRHPTTVPHRLLPGLSVVQSELGAFTSKFLRLCIHNRKTFNTMYSSMISEFQGHAPSTHAVYHADSPSSMPDPSTSNS